VAITQGGSLTTYTEDTDFYFAPFDRAPKRLLTTAGLPTAMVLPRLHRNIEIPGTWGFADERTTLVATMGAIADATTVTVTPSAITEFSPGQTLWLEDEMAYVRAVGATDLTVDRGTNGSTAAAHGAATSVYLVSYDARVVDAATQIAARRWRRRDTNQAAAFGESGFVQVAADPGELTILRQNVGELRCYRYRYEMAEAGVA
jgi:hypothetical protein